MKSLTLFIIPGGPAGAGDYNRVVSSLEGVVDYVEFLSDRRVDLASRDVRTDWYMFLYNNEWVDPKVKQAIPVFMEYPFDAIVLFKLVYERQDKDYYTELENRIFTVPRIFKKGVILNEEDLTPKWAHRLKFERLLDGWVHEDIR